MKIREKKVVRSEDSEVTFIVGDEEKRVSILGLNAALTLVKEEIFSVGEECAEYEIVGRYGSGSITELVTDSEIAKLALSGEKVGISVKNAETETGAKRNVYIIDALFDTANVRAMGDEDAIKNNVPFTFKDIIFFD